MAVPVMRLNSWRNLFNFHPPSSPPPPPKYPLREILTIGRCMHQMFIASNLFFVWRSILVVRPDMNKQQWRGEACVSMCWQDQIYFNKGRRIGGQLAQLDEIERWDKQGALLVQLYDVASLILGKLNRQTLWTGLGGREKSWRRANFEKGKSVKTVKEGEEEEEDGVQTLDLSQENVKLEKGQDKTVDLFLDLVFLTSLGWWVFWDKSLWLVTMTLSAHITWL